MKTVVVMVLLAVVAVLGALFATGCTPAKARTAAASSPRPSYAVTAQLGCAWYPESGVRAWIPGPCTAATGSAQAGDPDAYRLTVTNTGLRDEPAPGVTVGFYGLSGLIATARELLAAGRIAPWHAVRPVFQDQPPGTTSVRALGIRGR